MYDLTVLAFWSSRRVSLNSRCWQSCVSSGAAFGENPCSCLLHFLAAAPSRHEAPSTIFRACKVGQVLFTLTCSPASHVLEGPLWSHWAHLDNPGYFPTLGSPGYSKLLSPLPYEHQAFGLKALKGIECCLTKTGVLCGVGEIMSCFSMLLSQGRL